MDVQILNEIAAQARQAPPPQVGAPVSGNAQLKALKGSPPVPENTATPQFEGPPEQPQGPVTPNISSEARAASAYSAAVEAGLTPDEMNAIQALAGQIRPAVSEFLSQPGLEQAENAEAVVASNPEAVQQLEASLEQAVVETFSVPEIEDEVIVQADLPADPPNEEVPVAVPASGIPISVERVTNGAQPNAAVQEVPASPAVQNANAQNAVVQNPATGDEGPETSSGDFTVTAASPALVNSRAGEHANVENPATGDEGPETSSSDFTVTAASPALVNSRAGEHTNVENPATGDESPETSSNDFTGIASSPALVNPEAGENARVETPVSRPETASSPEAPVTAASPALQNAQVGENPRVETPVGRPETTSSPEAPVTAASPALQNAQGQNAEVGNPVNLNASSLQTDQPAAQVSGQVSDNGQAGGAVQPNPAPGGNPVPSLDSGPRPVEGQSPTLRSGGETVSPEAAQNATESGPSRPQPVPASSHNGFRSLVSGEDHAAVNPESVRDMNALVDSVVENEFTAEAKKIFSEPKVIRTVADLADFILERIREIIATKQLQKQTQPHSEAEL